jgi:hypothetical protein
VWARVHEKDFDQIQEFWEREGRESVIGPFKGRLANSLSVYPETLNMKLEIRIQPAGQRSLFFLEEGEHPLAIEQRLGIDMAKAREYVCILMRKASSEI